MNSPVASYSFFSAWDICAHQGYRRYIARDLPKTPETKEQAWGNKVHAAIDAYIKNGVVLPDDMPWEHFIKPIVAYGCASEKKLGITRNGRPCDFFADDVFLRGKLDAPIVVGEHALLLDWKTGKVREDPLELEIGALLLQAAYPLVRKITGRYVWLKEGRLGQEHDCSNTLRTWNEVSARMRNVEDSIKLNEFPKTPGPLCGWCPVLDCEHNRSKT